MSQLKAKIQSDLKAALKKREKVSVSTLRMLLSDIHNSEIQKRKELVDDEVMSVISSSVKRHQDSIIQFRSGGREDLALREEQELRLLQSYLPPSVPEEELRKTVVETITEIKASGSEPNLGVVMKSLMPKVKGRAPGNIISDLVKEELAK